MDFQKFSLELACYLWDTTNQDEGLSVFIHTTHALNTDELAVLERLKIKIADPKQTIFTAVLSKTELLELVDEPWITFIALSRKLQLKL